MSEDSAAEKEHEPTQHKLDEARKRGELVKSQDVSVAAAYLGFLIVAVGLGSATLMSLGGKLMIMIDQAEHLGAEALGGGSAALSALLIHSLISAAPWLLGPAFMILLGLIAQRAIVIAPEKLMPKLNRIDPFSNAKQKFGRSGLFEFAKSTLKMLVFAGLLGVFLTRRLPQIVTSVQSEAPTILQQLAYLVRDFVVLVLIISAVFAAIDYFWQRYEFLRRNRMTRQELMDEMKHSEGDPHIKGQRRQRAVEIATNKMLIDVETADVVIVNPTHFAVALKWSRGSGRAPVLVAKGVDTIAARIRERASEHGVPIKSDPPTARAIYATVEIGSEIQRDHYRAVAAAIRYAEMIRQKAGGKRSKTT